MMIGVLAHLPILAVNLRLMHCRLPRIVAPLQHPDLGPETPALKAATVRIALDRTAEVARTADEASALSVKDDSPPATANVPPVDVIASLIRGREATAIVRAIVKSESEIVDVTDTGTGIGIRTENTGTEIGIGRGARREIAILGMGRSASVMAARNARENLGAIEKTQGEILLRLPVHLPSTIEVSRHGQTQNDTQTRH